MILTIGVAGDGSFNTPNIRKHLKINHAERWTDLLAKKEASAVDKSIPTTGIGWVLVSVVSVLAVLAINHNICYFVGSTECNK